MWIFKNNFRPFAAPSKCRRVRPAPPHPLATPVVMDPLSSSKPLKSAEPNPEKKKKRSLYGFIFGTQSENWRLLTFSIE